MKFSATTAFITLATLASPSFAKSSRRGNGFTPSTGFHQLASRQVVTANICENIALDVPVNAAVCENADGNEVPIVPGLDLTGLVCSTIGAAVDVRVSDGICLCLAAGVLTDDSVADINLLVQTGGPAIELLTETLGGVVGLTVDQLTDALLGDATNLLSVSTTDCVYPPNSVPNSCDACTFDCPAGETPCGQQCIAEGDTCASGIARRSLKGTSNFICAQGQTACSVPSSRFFTLGGYECVDTARDVESCGGCTFAFAGQAQGQDCTALPNALDVTCDNGACVVQACSEGYEPNFDETACVAVGTNLGFVIEKKSIDLELSPVADAVKSLTGINVDPKVVDLDLLKGDILNIEKRTTGEDEPLINLNLEPITSLVGTDLDDIDVELLKTKLAKIQK